MLSSGTMRFTFFNFVPLKGSNVNRSGVLFSSQDRLVTVMGRDIGLLLDISIEVVWGGRAIFVPGSSQ